jgi:hypothetical protein
LYHLYLKNRKREHQHNLPSPMAWDHKKWGVIGEAIDMETLEKARAKRYGKEFIY